MSISLDLNLSESLLRLDEAGLHLPDDQLLSWQALEEIAANENSCYHIRGSEPHKIQFFSEELNRFYSLMPTSGAPTMLISGFPMHRIKGVDPHQDTLLKIETIRPVTGAVLDTTMGLGYTAIEAAKTADSVVTIEIDPTVAEVCRLNPWSQNLFNNDRISRRSGDAYEEVETFADRSFNRIFHDPPTFSLAGHLYSAAFYRHLHRVLAPRGRLFHYVGDLGSRSGKNVARGVVRRLKEIGFRRVMARPRAFGIVASK